MRYLLCSVFDSKVAAFGRPFIARTFGEAERSFADEVNRDAVDNPLFQHPEDYSLYQIGEFCDEDGSVTADVRVLVQGGTVVVSS